MAMWWCVQCAAGSHFGFPATNGGGAGNLLLSTTSNSGKQQRQGLVEGEWSAARKNRGVSIRGENLQEKKMVDLGGNQHVPDLNPIPCYLSSPFHLP